MATLTIKNNKGTVTLGTYQTQSYGLDLTVTSEGATIYDGSTYYYFEYAGAGTYRGLALRTYETEPAAGVGIGELYHMEASAASMTFYVAEAEADIIRIDVKGKVAVVHGAACIVCGNSDYLMRFSFDEAWDAHDEKIARFVYRKLDGVHHFDKPFTGTDLFVPKLSGVDSVLVGVYAGDLVTTTPANIPCKRSILCDSGTVEGAMVPSQYEELSAKIADLLTKVAELEARMPKTRILNGTYVMNDDIKLDFYYGNSCYIDYLNATEPKHRIRVTENGILGFTQNDGGFEHYMYVVEDGGAYWEDSYNTLTFDNAEVPEWLYKLVTENGEETLALNGTYLMNERIDLAPYVGKSYYGYFSLGSASCESFVVETDNIHGLMNGYDGPFYMTSSGWYARSIDFHGNYVPKWLYTLITENGTKQ